MAQSRPQKPREKSTESSAKSSESHISAPTTPQLAPNSPAVDTLDHPSYRFLKALPTNLD